MLKLRIRDLFLERKLKSKKPQTPEGLSGHFMKNPFSWTATCV